MDDSEELEEDIVEDSDDVWEELEAIERLKEHLDRLSMQRGGGKKEEKEKISAGIGRLRNRILQKALFKGNQKSNEDSVDRPWIRHGKR